MEGIASRNESDLFLGNEIWVPSDVFTSQDGQSLYLVEIEKFQVVDEKLKHIGQITGFSSNGAQDLLLVEGQGKKYEIPFVKEFIQEINYDLKVVKTQLPEGLLEINDED